MSFKIENYSTFFTRKIRDLDFHVKKFHIFPTTHTSIDENAFSYQNPGEP